MDTRNFSLRSKTKGLPKAKSVSHAKVLVNQKRIHFIDQLSPKETRDRLKIQVMLMREGKII